MSVESKNDERMQWLESNLVDILSKPKADLLGRRWGIVVWEYGRANRYYAHTLDELFDLAMGKARG